MPTDTEARIIAIVANWTRKSPELTSATSLRNDLGVGETILIEIVMDVEEGFDLVISDRDYHGWNTIGDIVKYVEERR